ncbi:hypothetical protein QA066_gp17 [Salmonella phage pink]|uniref:Uncharacterized protein n=1 Tax=Salmonella phage pink TaxID=2713312 RepID=A0A6G8R981_9CAUD|nr:hypothetical protein QA066_gp17 [Salmonella phage pink]QIN97970.1 hypothetical protein pink_17 [Salmonella phage pink]
MKRVCKEALRQRIAYLEPVSKLGLSINEEFQLEAYKMLLAILEKEIEPE